MYGGVNRVVVGDWRVDVKSACTYGFSVSFGSGWMSKTELGSGISSFLSSFLSAGVG